MRPAIIGITGRSGSGKTTLVQKIHEHIDDIVLSIHSLDDYYLDRNHQIADAEGYFNFDLPTSFDRKGFYNNLINLMAGQDVRINEYNYNDHQEPKVKIIRASPIIIVEGLFINHFSEINELIDYNIFVKLAKNECYNRRLVRDTVERNYDEAEVNHRFNEHAEPAFNDFITPFEKKADLVLINDCNYEQNPKFSSLMELLKSYIKKRGAL